MTYFELDIPMPDHYRDSLIKIVEASKRLRTLSFSTQRPVGSQIITVIIGDEPIDIPSYRDNPIKAYVTLDLLHEVTDIKSNGIVDVSYYITPKAYRWYEYQRRGKIGKWFARLPSYIRDGMIGIAFILSLILTILQIAELVR